ncbi:phytoene desaturase family protein [Rubrolithibacter danxiaensis]|uniref:phytoene desaturase family protein n=1 Tax=Rubrolithibacter danxiaensis TaxID=3390805 RepID=UPI003BF820F0
MKKAKIAVIGSGFAGLSAASMLAKEGHEVTIYEKNDQPGGRAAVWLKDGFKFDMGPSWYWMPDTFESYFSLFDKKLSDYYTLKRLDPGYRVYFKDDDYIDVPANVAELKNIFEQLESGSSLQLTKFLHQAAYKYQKGMKDFVFRPSLSVTEYFDLSLLKECFRIQLFNSMSGHVRRFFTNERIIKILEFPVLFLGATPQKTPALYSLMNYADLVLGTWYPQGGMNEIVKALVSLAEEQGVQICLNSEVQQIEVSEGKATGVHTKDNFYPADIVISNADYQHTDKKLLEERYQNYSARYWESRVLSPSCLLFYIGINKKVENIQHHNLFFDRDFDQHAKEIYQNPEWPSNPLFYVCCTSKTDKTVAPSGCENLFFLMPVAPGLPDTEENRERYYDILLDRFEKITGEKIRNNVVVKRSYALKDFSNDYHSFKGNAYGLANTLTQTAFLKPKIQSKKVKNLFFTGQLTVPGPGVPPALISGQVTAKEATRFLQNNL